MYNSAGFPPFVFLWVFLFAFFFFLYFFGQKHAFSEFLRDLNGAFSCFLSHVLSWIKKCFQQKDFHNSIEVSTDMRYIQSHLPLDLFIPNFHAVIQRIYLYIMNQTGTRGDMI